MKTGDIVFFRGTTFVSRVIIKLTKSPYTHVALSMSGTEILEADRFIKVRVRPIGDREIYKVKSPKIPLTNEDTTAMATYGLSMVGKIGYDYLDIFIWVLRLLFKWNIPLVERANSMYCTQMVDKLYQSINIDLVPDRPTGDVLPSHLDASPLLQDE